MALLKRYQIAKWCRPDIGIRFNGIEVDSGQEDEERGEFLVIFFSLTKKEKKGCAFF